MIKRLICLVMLFVATGVSANNYYQPHYKNYSGNGVYSNTTAGYTHQDAQRDFQSVYANLQADLHYAQNSGNTAQLQTVLLVLIELLQAQLSGQLGTIGTNQNGSSHGPLRTDIEVETGSARSISEERATLEGEIDFNRAREAYVFFEYGEDRDSLDERSEREEIDDNDNADISIRIDGLRDDERYYYRLVAIDRDTKEYVYGRIEDFKTDDENNSDRDREPEVITDSVRNVRNDSAELRGSVDMNDFRDGTVFFVWGEDEDAVADVPREDQFRDIDERGDDLQKNRVDTDLDSEEDYRLDIDSLDDDTRIYYAIGVEYEDEDGDDRIILGDIEDFRTER